MLSENTPYKTLTREQFLFREMRITANLKTSGLSDEEIIKKIAEENLFQYPTEKMIKNLAHVCIERLNALESPSLVEEIASGSLDTAKQVCVYAMICYYRLVKEFMLTVIGEKYRVKDYSFSRKDLNIFFVQLQEQSDEVASWSELSITKMKQVMTKMLVEAGYLESKKSEALNRILIDPDLKNVIEAKGDMAALIAFNYQ